MQGFLVFILVSLSAIYLSKKGYDAFFKKESKCEGCAFSKMGEINTRKR